MLSPLESFAVRHLVNDIQKRMLDMVTQPPGKRHPVLEAQMLVDTSRAQMDNLKDKNLIKDYAIDSSRLAEDWHMDKRGEVFVTTRELYGDLSDTIYRRESVTELNKKLSKLRHYGRRKKREAAKRFMETVLLDFSFQPVVPVNSIRIDLHLAKEFNNVPA